MSEGVLIAVIGIVGAILGAVVGGLIQAAIQRRKDDATVYQMITESVTSLVQPLNDRIDEQDKEIKALKIDLTDWKNWAYALVEQLKSFGCHEPVPFKSSKGK